MINTKLKHSYGFMSDFHQKFVRVLITLAICLNIAHVQAELPPGNTMVPFWVETTLEPAPAITLRWEPWAGATEHRIYRKNRNDSTFTEVAVLLGSATSWTDSSLAITRGARFDYLIRRTVSDPPEPVHGNPSIVEGIHPVGVELPLSENRGTVLLIVENVHASALANDLKRFEADLAGDGWTVLRADFATALANTEPGYKAQVEALKHLIKSKHTTVVPPLKSVILFGRLPVAYSGLGILTPDSHPYGAHPADSFFAEMDDVWPDTATDQDNNQWPPRIQNFPGDGKWDWDVIPDTSSFDLDIGRIDFNDMPAFSLLTDPTARARELLQRYLKKNHSFRFGFKEYPRRALLDTAGLLIGAHQRYLASSLIGMFGPQDFHWEPFTFFPELGANAYLWAAATTWACNEWTMCGIGSSAPAYWEAGPYFSEDPVRVPFTTLFASYIFDWDRQNSILRAPLCNEDTLAAVYLGDEANQQPPHYLGDMAIGDTIGYAVKQALHFRRSIGTNPQVPTWLSVMGDPTLRLHVVKPPSNVRAQLSAGSIDLNWTPSPEAVAGYHVYRGASHRGPFSRVNGNNLITGASFTDSTPSLTENVYMVRAIKREMTPSGTYTNASQGAYPALKLDAVGATPTTFQFTIFGGVGQECRIESATSVNATTWDTIATVTVTSGSTTYTHNTTDSQRFYRLASDQVPFWSENAIGFMRRIAPPEWSLIANQFNRGNNGIEVILPSVPEQTSINKYEDATGGYSSVHFLGGAWEGDLPLTFGPGHAAWIFNPTASPMSVTFMGDVPQGQMVNAIPAGTSIQSSMVPQAGHLQFDLGYPVSNGDSIDQYNPETGGYISNQFLQGAWEGDTPGGPVISTGESFYIYTGASKTWTREFKATLP